jgi:hypothetical protein
MDGVVEIVTSRERRRLWNAEDKLQLIAEMANPSTPGSVQSRPSTACTRACCLPGGGRCATACWQRRRCRCSCRCRCSARPWRRLGPTHPEPAAARPPARPPAPARPQAWLIEIGLGDGRQVRVDAKLNQHAL